MRETTRRKRPDRPTCERVFNTPGQRHHRRFIAASRSWPSHLRATTDRDMLARIAKVLREYLAPNFGAAGGGPTGLESAHR